ncbi:DUF4262 domain-containing protein [Amycolatopsis sp. NPDC004079]|uniref:DUF4262 domain-containing protein n=1 Tax=Amycolatopsis sp. NPDC004079 TaxID=3154549 RepID=UPI0033B2964A
MGDKLLTIIDRAGWAVIVVAHDDGSRFAYTVGLTLKRLPELCLSCPATEQGVSMLNDLAERQIRVGGFDPGQVTEAAGRPVRLDRCADLEPMILVRELCDGSTTAPTALAATVLN